jgi:hypothetical protein
MKLSEIKLTAPHVIIHSPPGRGKTALALTLGSVAQVIDMDNGLRTGLTLQDKWTSHRHSVDVKQALEDNPGTAVAFKKARSYIEAAATDLRAGRWPYKALVVDSLTALAESAMYEVLSNNGMLGKQPQIQHWGLAQILVQQVLVTLRSMPCVVMLTAHQVVREIDGVDVSDISVYGKNLPSKICGYFDEVWAMKIRFGAGTERQYLIQTTGSPSVIARTRDNVGDNLDANLGMIEILRRMGHDLTAVNVVTPNPSVNATKGQDNAKT